MSDPIATRYGVLGRALSIAVLQTIVLTARDGVNALKDIYLGLSLLHPPPDYSDPPQRRWQELLGNLFPTEILVVDNTGSPSPDLLDLPAADDEEHAIRRLLTAAASFLLAEITALDEILDEVSGAGEDVAGSLSTSWVRETRTQQCVASDASDVLLDHAEAGSWRTLLATHVSNRAPAVDALWAADVLPRDNEFPPVVVNFDYEPACQTSLKEPNSVFLPSPDDQYRHVVTPVLFICFVGITPQGKSQFVRTLREVAVDHTRERLTALCRVGLALQAISYPDLDSALRKYILDDLRRQLSHIAPP